MIFFVDGFVLDRNPSPRGGGFTVVNEQNELVKNHTIFRSGFTNNDGELLAIAYAAFVAGRGDTIITDSQAAYHWVKSGWPKKRPDLRNTALRAKQWIREKGLTLEWRGREENLAGHYNETMDRK